VLPKRKKKKKTKAKKAYGCGSSGRAPKALSSNPSTAQNKQINK
jgi:hypothetical protein